MYDVHPCILPGSLLFIIINLYCCIMRDSKSHNSGFIPTSAAFWLSLCCKSKMIKIVI